ncbi:unnamed protein product [Lampetra fluviatilis]
MVSQVSQLSLRGKLDNVLTWVTMRPCGDASPEPPTRVPARSKDIFSIVVTPDRIPRFTIPTLDTCHSPFINTRWRDALKQQQQQPEDAGQLDCQSCTQKQQQQQQQGERSSPEPVASVSVDPARKALNILDSALYRERLSKRSSTATCSSYESYSEKQSENDPHPDPATRAAMSMPHLAKITTPYGFPALGESPNIRRKESLFFEDGRPLLPLSSLVGRRKPGTLLCRSRSTPIDTRQLQKHLGSTCLEVEEEAAQPVKRDTADADCAVPKTQKSKFRAIIRKHLGNIRLMKASCQLPCNSDKTIASVERAPSLQHLRQ